MSLGTLGKKLQRDLKANPKKGLLLLLMVCGAGYFWGPILKRWVGGKSGQPGAVAAAPVILDDPKPADAAGKFKPPTWEKLQEFLHQDELTRSAELPGAFRDPFGIAALVAPQPTESTPAEQTPPPPTPKPFGQGKSGANTPTNGEPEKLGLNVSVSIGPRGSFAVIDRQLVREGGTFVMKGDKGDENFEFAVLRIEPWGVRLEHQGQPFVVEVPQPKLSNHDRIVRGREVRDEE